MKKIVVHRHRRLRRCGHRRRHCVPHHRSEKRLDPKRGFAESRESPSAKDRCDQERRKSTRSTNAAHRTWKFSKSELESYLLYSLKEDIPAQIDTADVQLGPDTCQSGYTNDFHFKRHRKSGHRCVGRRYAQFVRQRQDWSRRRDRANLNFRKSEWTAFRCPTF